MPSHEKRGVRDLVDLCKLTSLVLLFIVEFPLRLVRPPSGNTLVVPNSNSVLDGH